MMHDEDGRLDVHDVVPVLVVEEPVVEEGELGIAGGNLVRARRQQPPDHSPPGKTQVNLYLW